MRKILLLFSVAALLSCGSNSQNDVQIKKLALNHKVCIPDMRAFAPSLQIIDSMILVVSGNGTMIKDNFTSLYSLNSFEPILSFGNMGKARNEFNSARPAIGNEKVNCFALYDYSTSRIFSYHIDVDAKPTKVVLDSIKNIPPIEGTFGMDNTAKYNEEYNIGLLLKGNDELFALLDNDYNVVSTFGENPYEDVSMMSMLNRFQGKLKVRDEYIIYAITRLPYIVCYTIEDGIPKKLWDDQYLETNHTVNSNTRVMHFAGKDKGWVLDISLGDKYIYIFLYDGNKNTVDFRDPEKCDANKVLVYNYKGTQVAELTLDARVWSGAVSEDERTLYGVARIPEFSLVSYDLPENYK